MIPNFFWKIFIEDRLAWWDTENYIKDLITICQSLQIDLVIPTCEEIYYLSKHKERFLGISQVFVDDFSKLKLFHNKWSFMNLLQKMGENTPKSWLIEDVKELQALKKRPLILKPVYSRFGSKVYLINNDKDLPHITASKKFPWIVQEYLLGDVWCCYSVAKKGLVTLHTNYISDIKFSGGATVHFEHNSNPYIEEFVKRVVLKTNFTGQIAFDFIQVGKDNFIPIECNPRATSGIHLLSSIPSFVDNFIGGSLELQQPLASFSACLKLPLYVLGFQSLRSSQTLKKWLKALKTKDVLFKRNDLIPVYVRSLLF